MQRQFLHSPIGDFAHNYLIRAPAIEFMCRPEFLQKLSCRPELPDNLPVKLHLIDFAILHVSGAARIGAEEILMRAGRDADSPGRPHVQILRLEFPVVIEDLNSPVATIPHIHGSSWTIRASRGSLGLNGFYD